MLLKVNLLNAVDNQAFDQKKQIEMNSWHKMVLEYTFQDMHS